MVDCRAANSRTGCVPLPASRHKPRTGPAHLFLLRELIKATHHTDRALTAHPAGADARGMTPLDQERVTRPYR